MMNSMRKMASGFVAKLLMLFLIITFAVWGIGDIFRESGGNYAAKVGSETIGISEFGRQKAAIEQRAEALGLKGLDPRTLDLTILRQMVQQRLLREVMRDLGLYTSNSLLAAALKNEPAFKNKDGSFNKGAFVELLQSQRISEAELLRQIGDEINTKFLLSSMDVSDIRYPDAMRALAATAALETRDAWIITIAPTGAPSDIDEASLKAFYEQNKSVLYVKPESRTLEYVALTPQQVEAAIDRSITSEMLADAKKRQPQLSAEAVKAQLRKEQREQGMHTLEGAIDDALAGGATLAEALGKANLSAPIRTLSNVSDKDLKAAESDVLKAVLTQGFQMGDGETSGLILSEGGTPLLVHVKSLTIAGAQAYDEVAADVRKRVAEQLRRDAARAKVQEVKEALSKNGPALLTEAQLQEALAPFGLKAAAATGLSRPQAGAKTDLPMPLHYAIFERQPGDIAGPLMLADGRQMLAVVSKLHHPDRETVLAKTKSPSEKDRKQEIELLTQAVQARSFADFSARHKVKINTRLLSQPAGADAEAP